MFDALITYQARAQPRAPAIMNPRGAVSYGEFEANINRMAAGLRRLGLSPADGVVSVDLSGRAKLLAVMALARLGITSSGPTDPAADVRLVDTEHGDGSGRRIVLSPEWQAEMFAADPVPVPTAPWDLDGILRIKLSSGTTRAPRRVAFTRRAYEASLRTSLISYGAGKGGLWKNVTGIDSGMGFNHSVAAWAVGGSVFSMPASPTLVQAIETLRPSVLSCTPTFLRTIMRLLPWRFGLRVVVGGGLLPVVLAQEVRLRLSPDLRILYGATESSGIAMVDATVQEQFPGAAGYPLPGVDIRILDDAGAPLAPGGQGQVWIKALQTAAAYIGDPEASARSFRHGGFMPGDIGHLAPDGLLVLDGRADDRMNLGGFKFMPNLMEDVAITCPGVVDCAAFPVPDSRGIDECWLAVVQGEGFERERLAALLTSHRPQLPPVRFAWTEEIPRNDMGKVERLRLREEAMAVLGLQPEP